MTAFWDLPAPTFRASTEFWLNTTRSTLSPYRGPDGEFATLFPPNGDPYLRVQRVESGDGGNHLDLHVDSVAAEADRAASLGATRIAAEEELAVMRSPGGFPFCVVDFHGESRRTGPVFSPAGQHSLVDQLCIDIPPHLYDREVEFWSALTDRKRVPSIRAEFERLERSPGEALELLLQRLESAGSHEATRAHVDLACTDVDAEAERHAGLGAVVGERFGHWRVMNDPSGLPYCITTRDPDTGRMPVL